MKRLATKMSILSKDGLTAAEQKIVYYARDIHREKERARGIFNGELGQTPEWRLTCVIARRKYAKYGVSAEDSHSLCWEAIDRCIMLDHARDADYVYKAVDNAHKRYVREGRDGCVAMGELPDEAVPDDLDAVLDVEDALSDLEDGDAEVCRRRIWGGESFAEIADGSHHEPVRRQYDRAADRLRRRLGAYDGD